MDIELVLIGIAWVAILLMLAWGLAVSLARLVEIGDVERCVAARAARPAATASIAPWRARTSRCSPT